MTVSNIIGPFMVAADRFIIASILGASLLTYYTVPQDIVLRLLIIPAAISTAWFPRFARLKINSDIDKSKKLASQGYKYIFTILGPLCMFLSIFSEKLLEIWIDVEFAENAGFIAVILLIGVFFNALAHIPLASLQATGKVKTTALLHLVELCLYLPLLFYFVPLTGIKGAAVIWSLRTILDFVFLFIFDYFNLNDYPKL
jgi:O-antigen/teichoic acid export membrane protein